MAKPGVIRFACALLLALLAATTAGAAERDPALDSAIRAFVDTWTWGNLRAFDALAADPPARGEAWRWVRATLRTKRCIDIHGARWTIEENDGKRAHAVVDIEAMIDGKPMGTPWSVGLMHDGRGWRVAAVSSTADEMALAFILGKREWWQSCLGKEVVPPGALGYHLADEASRSPTDWTARNDQALDEAEGIARELDDRMLVAFCHVFRARLAFNQRHYDDAVRWGEAGVAESKAGDLVDPLAAAQLFLGLAEWKLGRNAEALVQLEQAADSLGCVTNPRIAIGALLNIVNLHLDGHQFRSGVMEARRALSAARQAGWTEGEMTALGTLAGIHDELRDFRAGRTYWMELLTTARKWGLENGDSLAGLAADELALGDVAGATRHLREALQLQTDAFAIARYKTLYGAALLRGRHEAEAERALREAIAAGREVGEGTAMALSRLSGLCLRRHRTREALALAREAVVQQQLHGMNVVEGATSAAHLALGRALSAVERKREAIAELRAAVESVESERRALPGTSAVRFYENNAEPYQELAELLVRSGRPLEALQVAERMRSRALIEWRERDGGLASRLSPDDERRRKQLEDRVEDLNRELVAGGDVRKQLEAVRVEVDRFTEEMALLHGGESIDEEPMQRSLPAAFSDTVLLEYVVTERNTIVFAVRRKGGGLDVRARVLPLSRARLAKRVARFTARIAHRDPDCAEDAAALYRDLVAPVEATLGNVSMVAVVPDMELWSLPFHALRRASGRYLIEDAGVFYAPSLTVLQTASRRARRRTQPPALLAFGNPVPGNAAAAELRAAGRGALLGALPDAEREVRSIAALYDAQRSRVYVGHEAKESVFKRSAPHYDVLHLATHGLLDDDAPMYSALLLAASDGGRGDDGLLETREIVHMRLNAGLVVLAACNTARGSVTPGEGVVGLSWAFLVAGCPTTVVSQWAASSAPTSELMIDFHTALTRGKSKAEALRAAQLAMLHGTRYQHPFYWAPFILVGIPF